MAYLAVFLTAFFAALIFTPLARRLSRRLNIFARPGGRRQHQGVIAKLGGLPLLLGVGFATAVIYILIPPDPSTADSHLLRGVVIGSLVIFTGGLIDGQI